MSQFTYKSFAVVGAGGQIGAPITKALLSRGVSVVILTRPQSTSNKPIPEGAEVETVDYANVSAVADILSKHKIQVVVSAVNAAHGGLSVQSALADAAKKAGVKLFVPSEYGFPTEGHVEGVLGEKNAFADYLTSIGIPWVRLYVGLFIEIIPWLTGQSTSSFHVIGNGNMQGSWTSDADIAGFLAHVLTTLAPSELDNAAFRIQGDRASLLEIAALYGDKFPVKHHEGTLPSEVPGSEFSSLLQGFVEAGWASNGWNFDSKKDTESVAGNSNHLWKDHEWKTIKGVLNL